ncbi:hypothetical protein Peur_060534 [Populus x canadensis]
MSILVSCPCNTLIIPIQISRDYIRAHYQLDQQFGDNSFDRKQDESRLPKIYPERCMMSAKILFVSDEQWYSVCHTVRPRAHTIQVRKHIHLQEPTLTA